MSRQLTAGIRPGLPGVGVADGISGTVAITPGYSDAPGAWTELVAATTLNVHWISLFLGTFAQSGQSLPGMADIGVGAGGAEVAVISNWAIGGANGEVCILPIRIAAGSRISFRYSSTNATLPSAPTVRLVTYARTAGDLRSSPASLVGLGVTATNTGTTVNSDDTWVELVASTVVPYQGLVHAFSIADAGTSTAVDTHTLGVGASGSEVAISSTGASLASIESHNSTIIASLKHIPAGSRIAGKSSNGAANITQFAPLAIPYT